MIRSVQCAHQINAAECSRLSPVSVVGVKTVLQRVEAGQPFQLGLGDALKQPVGAGMGGISAGEYRSVHAQCRSHYNGSR